MRTNVEVMRRKENTQTHAEKARIKNNRDIETNNGRQRMREAGRGATTHTQTHTERQVKEKNATRYNTKRTHTESQFWPSAGGVKPRTSEWKMAGVVGTLETLL